MEVALFKDLHVSPPSPRSEVPRWVPALLLPRSVVKLLLMETGTGSDLSPNLTLPLTSAPKTQHCSSGELCRCLEKDLSSGQGSGMEHLLSSEMNSFHFFFPPSHPGVSHRLTETLAPALAASKYKFGPFVEQVLGLAAGSVPSWSQSSHSD